jgi:hypothetical protein
MASKDLNILLEYLLLFQLQDDILAGFLMVVSQADREFSFEFGKAFVLFEEPLLPKHVYFVVDVLNDLLQFVIIEPH